MTTVAIVAEHDQGKLKPVFMDLVAFARTLGRHVDVEIKVVVLGAEVTDAAEQIAVTTGLEVIALQCPDARDYTSEVYLLALTDVLNEMAPAYICLAHSSQGLDYGPALAVKLGAGCISGVENIFAHGDGVGFTRPVYGGRFVSRLRPLSDRTVILVQPGVFKAERNWPQEKGRITLRHVEVGPSATTSLGTRDAGVNTSAITEARVIVSAGKGVGEKENLDLVRRLAELFPNSAVAGSRIVCDLGWLDYRQQVGVTGATVAPELYIACGISGALQHVMAMRGSGFVVSINTDPQAAIFNESDVCIVEDLKQFIPAFVETCKEGS